MKQTKNEVIFSSINYFILIFIAVATIYPFIYVLSASFSSPDAVVTGKVLLLPKDITLDAYKRVFEQMGIWMAYANSIYYTVVGTLVSVAVTICGAYPLSKRRLKGRKVISFAIAFTMWFNAGMIPFYLTLKEMNLLNTRLAMIVPFACATFYVILLRTFFQSVPESLEEAATIDGANDLQILYKIYLPLSMPALTTIGLFYAVNKWNGYFWAMVILRDDSKIPLQVILKRLIVEMNLTEQNGLMEATANLSQETIIYATIIISIIPMILIYPFIQRHFVKGVMIGSVKG